MPQPSLWDDVDRQPLRLELDRWMVIHLCVLACTVIRFGWGLTNHLHSQDPIQTHFFLPITQLCLYWSYSVLNINSLLSAPLTYLSLPFGFFFTSVHRKPLTVKVDERRSCDFWMLMAYSAMAILSSTCRHLELRISPSCDFSSGAIRTNGREPMEKNNVTVISYLAWGKYLQNSPFLWIFGTP